MSCCGSKRAVASASPGSGGPVASGQAPAAHAAVELEYKGRTTLRARGPVSGRDYWFAHPGARVRVDVRDAPALDGVPNLVRAPRP